MTSIDPIDPIDPIDSSTPFHPYVPFTEYSFTYQALDRIKFPAFPNLLLHGAFGNALHKNICVLPDHERYDKKCASCGIRNECGYPYIFKRHYLSSNNQFPQPAHSSPYVFRYQSQGHTQILAKHYFDLKLVIFAKANEKIDYFINGMKTLGEQGISQSKAQLVGIQQNMPTGLPVFIKDRTGHIPPTQPDLPIMPKKVMIQFVTPYVMRDELLQEPFDMSYWLMAIIRRLSRLQNTFTDYSTDADFTYLKSLTQSVCIDRPELYFYETPITRKSHSSGILGSVVLNLQGMEELWPWLYLGQWFHVGKKTSSGNGRYRLLLIDAKPPP